MPPLARLDAKIAALEQKLEKLRALRAAFDDAEIAAEVASLLAVDDAAPPLSMNGNQVSSPASPRPSLFQQIESFFRSRNNDWATISEIVAATSRKKPSIRQILYKAKPDAFSRQGGRGKGKESLFRLKT